MPLYYTPEPINKVAPVKVKPTKTSARSMTNNVNNYNNWARTQAGAQGHTNINSQEYTRRQTVNATRKLRGLGDKYPMPTTTGTKQVKTTIGRHRGETSGGGNRSGKGAGVKGVKSKPAGKKTTGKKTPKPEGWVNPNRHKPKVTIGSGRSASERMNLTSTGGGTAYDKFQKEQQEKHSRKRIENQEKKSLDIVQGTFQGMLAVLKTGGFKARVTGVDLNSKMRHTTNESGQRTVKEVPAGSLNLQSTIGAGSEKRRKPTGKLIKTYSFNSLDTSLDTLKALGDNERYNKDKFPKITTDAKKLPKGGDDSRTPKAIGESKRDQKVMQS